MADKRKDRRLDINRPGYVAAAPGAPLLECLVTDISKGGAKIEAAGASLPAQFILFMTPQGGVARICAVRWRRGAVVGVKFLQPPKPARARGDEAKANPVPVPPDHVRGNGLGSLVLTRKPVRA